MEKVLKKLLPGMILLLATVNGIAYADESVQQILPKDLGESSDYAKQAIVRLADKGVIVGDNNGNFNPHNTVTRAEMVTMIVKSLNLDISNVPDTPTFSDVPKDHWAYRFVEAAYKNGITSGVGPSVFGVDQTLTREQMATMYTKSLGLTSDNLKDLSNTRIGGEILLNRFVDKNQISDWAKDPATFAVNEKLITGTGTNTFGPQEPAKREQIAVVTDRYIQNETKLSASADAFRVASTAKITPDAGCLQFHFDRSVRTVQYGVVDPNINSETSVVPAEYMQDGMPYISPGRRNFHFRNHLKTGKTYTIDYSITLYNGETAQFQQKVTITEKVSNVSSVKVLSSTQIEVLFKEPVDVESVHVESNFAISDSNGQYSIKHIMTMGMATEPGIHGVILTVDRPFANGSQLNFFVSDRLAPAHTESEHDDTSTDEFPPFETVLPCRKTFGPFQTTVQVNLDTVKPKITGVSYTKDSTGRVNSLIVKFDDALGGDSGNSGAGIVLEDSQGKQLTGVFRTSRPQGVAEIVLPVSADYKIYNGTYKVIIPENHWVDLVGNGNIGYQGTINFGA